MGSGIFGAINYRSPKYPGGLYLVQQLRDIRRDPPRLIARTASKLRGRGQAYPLLSNFR